MTSTPDHRVLVAPEEVLESERAGLITGMAIVRAWRDPDFRRRLLTAPREVLSHEGLEIPEEMDIRVFEDTPAVRHIAITHWTSEPEELVPLFREIFPLPEGHQVRLVQNSEKSLCLVLPVAPSEPETLTDVEELRKLAPRASIFASGESIITSITSEFGEGESASASASAHVNTETATATATAWDTAEVTVSGSGPGFPGPTAPSAQVSATASGLIIASGSASSVVVNGESAMVASSSSASAEAEAEATTSHVTSANEWLVTDVSVVSEAASATAGLEAEAAVTTTTVGAEAELGVLAVAVAVGAIVAT